MGWLLDKEYKETFRMRSPSYPQGTYKDILVSLTKKILENQFVVLFFLNRVPRKRFCWKWINYIFVTVLCLGGRPWNWSDLKENSQGLLETTETHVSTTLILKGNCLPLLVLRTVGSTKVKQKGKTKKVIEVALVIIIQP